MGNNFLMHRFTGPKPDECLDDNVCYEQIPKRINGHVDPDKPPDSNVSWGLQLEEGYSERLVFVFFSGVVASGVVGLVWSICVKDLQSGFVVASWILTSEAVVVGVLQLLLFLGAV